jgi:hypothetical protein
LASFTATGLRTATDWLVTIPLNGERGRGMGVSVGVGSGVGVSVGANVSVGAGVAATGGSVAFGDAATFAADSARFESSSGFTVGPVATAATAATGGVFATAESAVRAAVSVSSVPRRPSRVSTTPAVKPPTTTTAPPPSASIPRRLTRLSPLRLVRLLDMEALSHDLFVATPAGPARALGPTIRIRPQSDGLHLLTRFSANLNSQPNLLVMATNKMADSERPGHIYDDDISRLPVELARLHQIAAEINSGIELVDVLDNVVYVAAEESDARMSAIFLMNDDGVSLRLGSQLGLSDELTEAWSQIRVGYGAGGPGGDEVPRGDNRRHRARFPHPRRSPPLPSRRPPAPTWIVGIPSYGPFFTVRRYGQVHANHKGCISSGDCSPDINSSAISSSYRADISTASAP